MPFIAKTAPLSGSVGDIVTIEERPMYGGGEIQVGDLVFLWTSEQQGGRGLWASGSVVRIGGSRSKVSADVRIEQAQTVGKLGVSELAPHRDSLSETPVAALSRKLYKHAHNKIAQLSTAEAEFLKSHMR